MNEMIAITSLVFVWTIITHSSSHRLTTDPHTDSSYLLAQRMGQTLEQRKAEFAAKNELNIRYTVITDGTLAPSPQPKSFCEDCTADNLCRNCKSWCPLLCCCPCWRMCYGSNDIEYEAIFVADINSSQSDPVTQHIIT